MNVFLKDLRVPGGTLTGLARTVYHKEQGPNLFIAGPTSAEGVWLMQHFADMKMFSHSDV